MTREEAKLVLCANVMVACDRAGFDKRTCELVKNALDVVLKEQEAVKPIMDEYGNKRCGSCGIKLQSISDPDLFCCKCGRKVKWE